jgi:HAMP domain-containing protein
LSLFVRLWLVGTTIALASAGIAIVADTIVDEHHEALHAEKKAVTLARMAGSAISIDPLSDPASAETDAVIRARARNLIATGRMVSLTVVTTDLHPIAQETLPGLEDEEALARLGPEPFATVGLRQTFQVVSTARTTYVLMPLTDSAERPLGVLAIGLPIELLHFDDDTRLMFAVLAVALSVLLGLLAAVILTRQVAAPISRLAKVADRLDTGQYDVDTVTPLIGRRDEIGRLARVMLRLVRALDHLGREMDAAVERRLREYRDP